MGVLTIIPHVDEMEANYLLRQDAASGGNAYTSDADGNTLTGGGRTNAWDSQNRLASCTKRVSTL